MSKRPLITAAYCLKNGEDFLWESITSVYNYVDQIIFVDDESTDRTIEIIKSFPQDKITLVQGKYNKNKAAQRTEYLKRAKGVWLMQIDDDEIYMESHLVYLRNLIQSPKFQNINEIFFRYLWLWKDGQHVIHGHHWDQRFETFYRNLPGLKYEVHHYVSHNGQPLCKRGPSHTTDKVIIYHYSHCKPDEKIRAKLRYYMLRDNPNCTVKNVDQYVNKHPHFSNNFSHPRFGPGGLQIAGTVGSQKDRIEEYTGPHPSVMKGHHLVMKNDLEKYKIGMNKYMEECWRFHNHLHFPRHTARIQYTAEFLKGRSVEIGCADGTSTNIMYQHLKKLGKTDVVLEGIEPTHWGFSQAVKNHPHLHFTKAMGEQLPFKDGEFTTVLCAEVIEHCLNPEIFIKEAARVCKSRLIVTTPSQWHDDPDHRRFFTPITISKLVSPHCKVSRIYGLTENGERCTDLRKIYFMICVCDK